MGKKAKAGKPNKKLKQQKQAMKEWEIVRQDIEREYAKKMLPVAVQEAWILLLAVGGTILHDYFGFGKTRIKRWADHVLDWQDSIYRDYVSIDEIADEFTRLTGCTYALNEKDIETLQEYGMMGMIDEIKLMDAQMQYMHDRISQGWESTVNRYGEKVV